MSAIPSIDFGRITLEVQRSNGELHNARHADNGDALLSGVPVDVAVKGKLLEAEERLGRARALIDAAVLDLQNARDAYAGPALCPHCDVEDRLHGDLPCVVPFNHRLPRTAQPTCAAMCCSTRFNDRGVGASVSAHGLWWCDEHTDLLHAWAPAFFTLVRN